MTNTHKCISYTTFEETDELAQDLSAVPAKVPKQALLVLRASRVLPPQQSVSAFCKCLLGDFCNTNPCFKGYSIHFSN